MNKRPWNTITSGKHDWGGYFRCGLSMFILEVQLTRLFNYLQSMYVIKGKQMLKEYSLLLVLGQVRLKKPTQLDLQHFLHVLLLNFVDRCK